jgi:hypothetical protein
MGKRSTAEDDDGGQRRLEESEGAGMRCEEDSSRYRPVSRRAVIPDLVHVLIEFI